jgi:hypothetical protein
MPAANNTIAITYPSRRVVSTRQIQDWAHDDLANEEGRRATDEIPLAFAVAIVDYYGSITVAAGHGLVLPEYSANTDIPGVMFKYECEGHSPGPCDPMGETVYCDGSCRAC